MEKSTFSVAYDGPAVDQGVMDARSLGPALLALSDLLEDANAALNGEKARVRVNIRSGFETGSFQIDLELVQTILEGTKSIVGIAAFYRPNDILEALGLCASTGMSYLKLMKWLKGRRITKETVLDNGRFRIETSEPFDVAEITDQVARIYRYPRSMDSLGRVLEPLRATGIELFEARDDNAQAIEAIPKGDLPYFEHSETPTEELEPVEYTGTFQLVAISFDPQRSWRITDGAASFSADLIDKHFIGQVERRLISFANGDMIQARIRRRQFRAGGKLQSKYEIIEVIEFRGSDQLAFDIS